MSAIAVVEDEVRELVRRGGIDPVELTTTMLSEDRVRDLAEWMLTSSGRHPDLSAPFVDARPPEEQRVLR